MITFALSLFAGCAVSKGRSLLVVTATNIGIKIGVNELTQMPQGEIGYNRIEGSVVPVDDKQVYTVPTIARLNFQSAIKNPSIESLIATGDAANAENLKKSGLIKNE